MYNLYKFKFIFFLCISFSLFTCSSDDDNDSNNDTEGTWLLTSFKLDNSYDINNDGTANNDLLLETSCNVQQRFVFDSDGTGQLTSEGESIFLDEQEVNGNAEYIVECEDADSSIGYAWTEDGNNILLTQTFLGDTELQKSNNELTYFLPNAFEMPIIVNNEFTGYETVNVTFIYTKQ